MMAHSDGTKRRVWTSRDLATLREHANEGAAAVAELLGCTPCAVRRAAHRHRVSLRRPGSLRGLVLGQPRGVSLRRDLREDLVHGRVDPEVVAARMQLDEDAELCPSCGHRPIRVASTGLCRCCHLNRLTHGHHEVIAKLTAQRELNRVKQERKRLRDRVAVESAESAGSGLV
jgi:proline racemase